MNAEQRKNLGALIAIGERLERGELDLDWCNDQGDCDAPKCFLGWYNSFHRTDFQWHGQQVMADVMEHFGLTHVGQTKYLFGPNTSMQNNDEEELAKRMAILRRIVAEPSGSSSNG